MAAPAGAITNVGKMFIVGAVGAGALSLGVNVLDHAHGQHGVRITTFTDRRVTTDYGGLKYVESGDEQAGDGWRKFARLTDFSLLVGGGVLSIAGGTVAAYDVASAARALGESPVHDAVRGGAVRAGAEVLLGLGLGALAVAATSAFVNHAIEGNH